MFDILLYILTFRRQVIRALIVTVHSGLPYIAKLINVPLVVSYALFRWELV